MTAPDPRLDEIEARLAAVPAKGESQFVGLALPVAATTELWNLRQLARADVAYLLAELRKAHAAVRAARFVVSVREAELLKLKGLCSNNDCTLHYAHSGPCNEDRTQARAAVAAANGDGEKA